MKTLIIAAVMFISLNANADENSGYKFSGFAGVGPGYTLPGPLRFRFNNVELGTYGIAFGTVRSFRKEHVYAQFGAGISALGQMDVGLIGAVGAEYIFLWRLGVRGEFFTFYGSRAITYSGATIGLSFSF